MTNSSSRPPVQDISAALRTQLELLRTSYGSRLEEKIGTIDDLWNRLLGLEGWGTNRDVESKDLALMAERNEVLADLHRAAHTLAGSGATLGFPHVSEAARHVEILLKPLNEGEIELIESVKLQIEGSLTALRTSSRAPEEGDFFSRSLQELESTDENRAIYLFSDARSGPPSWCASLRAFGYQIQFFDEITRLEAALLQEMPAAMIVDCAGEPIACGQDGKLLSSTLATAQRHWKTRMTVIWVCVCSDLRNRLQAVRLGGAAFFPQPVDVDALLVKLHDLTAHAAPEAFRILIVDDEASLGKLFSLILRQAGMETCIVNDPLQIVAELVDFRPDLILMDLYMPGCSGIELSSVIRQQEIYVGIPIMFLSVETDVSKQLEAMRQGGDEFLIKPVQPRHLISAVTTRVTRARTLRNLMVRDSLTGLLNHTKVKEQLEIELDRARRVGNTVSLAMIDIDNFKIVNDTYGHATGDGVLRSLSRLLDQRLRQTDVIGRYGGEEFAVIMTGSNAEDARLKLEIVRAAFANLIHVSDGREFGVTFSAGIASSPNYGDAKSLSEAADRALYEAKRAGRNRVALAD